MSDQTPLNETDRTVLRTIHEQDYPTLETLVEATDKSERYVREDVRNKLADHGYPTAFSRTDQGYYLTDDAADPAAALTDTHPSGLPDLDDVDAGTDPDPSELTDREAYLATELQTGATVDELAADLDERPTVITQHLRDLKSQGWQVYVDESAEHVAIEGDHTLRSSEHTGTRTRKANRWWEARHNALVREFKALDTPDTTLTATDGREDWVTHLTDLHAGDKVRGYDDSIVHETADLPAIIDHITQRSVALSRKHGSEYDVSRPLWTGDFVTNSGIYEGQFEDLDAWLDEQIDILHDPLLRQLKTFAREFPAVHVVCQAGNHGDIRASGSSKQANADLILYKSIRNTVSALQDEGLLENVKFTIGRAGSVTPFRLRGGKIHGQLRHGQDRSPQADTSARKKEWLSTILDSMNSDDGEPFDIAWMGHHHVSGMLPWNGPPVFITGSPKPAGEYPRQLGEVTGPNTPTIAHVHGVSDDGVTGVFPIDTRHFDHA